MSSPLFQQPARREDRSRIVYAMPVTGRDTGRTLGCVVDISDHGVLLITGKPQLPAQSISFRVALPRAFGSGERIDLDGEVRWCRNIGDDRFLVGIGLSGLPGDRIETLRELAARFASDEETDDWAKDPYLEQWDLLDSIR